MSTPPKPFISDGASGFISFFYEIITKKKLPWEHCALEHDKAYWQGGNLKLRKEADNKLCLCVWNYYDTLVNEIDKKREIFGTSFFSEAKDVATVLIYMTIPTLVYLGVRIGGAYWIPFPSVRKVYGKWKFRFDGVRWGFGFNYPRYK